MNKLLLLSALLLFISCASIDLPPGGEKDTQHPKLLSSSPDSVETFFTGNQIKLTFDEYFTLNNLNQRLIISPPLTSSPKTVIKGKNLLLQLNEVLKPNTTYQFYFADGIKDLNEGNPTKNLRLVFSTGPYIDTAVISGQVKNAFSLKPEEDIKVFLYKEYADSQLLLQTPYYITKTDKTGQFSFNNIADGTYYCYSVKDDNNNNKLDLNERVAFASKPFLTNTSNNTLLVSRTKLLQKLRVLNTEETSFKKFKFTFNRPVFSNTLSVTTDLVIGDLSKDKTVPWHYGQTNDTLYIYLNSEQLNVGDTIVVNIQSDTIYLSESLEIKTTKTTAPKVFSQKTTAIKTPISLTADYAIRKTNDKLIKLFDLSDSVFITIDSSFITTNSVSIHSNWKENHSYRIFLEPKAITYYNQKTNLSDTFSFFCLSSEKTGEIQIQIHIDSNSQRQKNYVLVLEKNNATVRSKKVSSDTLLTFLYLEPGDYSAYLFLDLDTNNTWQDVDYLNKNQSEPIWHINTPINVRAKWKTKGITVSTK